MRRTDKTTTPIQAATPATTCVGGDGIFHYGTDITGIVERMDPHSTEGRAHTASLLLKSVLFDDNGALRTDNMLVDTTTQSNSTLPRWKALSKQAIETLAADGVPSVDWTVLKVAQQMIKESPEFTDAVIAKAKEIGVENSRHRHALADRIAAAAEAKGHFHD